MFVTESWIVKSFIGAQMSEDKIESTLVVFKELSCPVELAASLHLYIGRLQRSVMPNGKGMSSLVGGMALRCSSYY